MEAQSGTLSFSWGGTLGGSFAASAGAAVNFAGGTFALGGAGVVSSGAGQVVFTGGDIAFSGPISNFNMTGGTLVGTNVVTGTLNWTGGMIGGALTVASTGVLNISGSGGKSLYNGVLTNAGTVVWTGAGYLDSYSEGIYNLAGGLVDIQNDQSLYYAPSFMDRRGHGSQVGRHWHDDDCGGVQQQRGSRGANRDVEVSGGWNVRWEFRSVGGGGGEFRRGHVCAGGRGCGFQRGGAGRVHGWRHRVQWADQQL